MKQSVWFFPQKVLWAIKQWDAIVPFDHPVQPWPWINPSLSRSKPNTVSCQQKTHGWPSVHSGFLPGLTTQKTTRPQRLNLTISFWRHVYQNFFGDNMTCPLTFFVILSSLWEIGSWECWNHVYWGNRLVIYGFG